MSPPEAEGLLGGCTGESAGERRGILTKPRAVIKGHFGSCRWLEKCGYVIPLQATQVRHSLRHVGVSYVVDGVQGCEEPVEQERAVRRREPVKKLTGPTRTPFCQCQCD